jgi:hypothetical protein
VFTTKCHLPVCRPVDRPLDLLVCSIPFYFQSLYWKILSAKFLLDGSGSVGGNTFQTQMQLLNRLVDVLEIGPESSQSQLAVMQSADLINLFTRTEVPPIPISSFRYATYSFVEFPFNAHRASLPRRNFPHKLLPFPKRTRVSCGRRSSAFDTSQGPPRREKRWRRHSICSMIAPPAPALSAKWQKCWLWSAMDAARMTRY